MPTIPLPSATPDPLRSLEVDPAVVVSVTPTTDATCTIATRGGDLIRIGAGADDTARRLGLTK